MLCCLARAVASQAPAAGVGSDLHTPQIQGRSEPHYLTRCHLDQSQRAMVTTGIAKLQDRQRKGSPIGEAVTKGAAADLLTSASVALSAHALSRIGSPNLSPLSSSAKLRRARWRRCFTCHALSCSFPIPAFPRSGARQQEVEQHGRPRGDRRSTRAFSTQKPSRSPIAHRPPEKEERYKAFDEWRRESV